MARLLDRLDQEFVVIDSNPARADELREAGLPMVFGDAAAEPVLEAADVGKARLVVVTMPDAAGVRLTIDRIKGINPEVHIVARSATVDQLEELGELGVYEAVQPEFEAALELGRQALSHLGVGATEIHRFSDRVRSELYAPMETDSPVDDALLTQLRRTSRMIETEWVRLPEESELTGKTIGEMGLRSKLGISVVAVIRGDEVIPNPGPEAHFEPGDMVGTLGTPDQTEAFRVLANGG